MSGPIYVPRGAAKEYGDYALNLYTGCPHRCYYCFAPRVLHKTREEFHSHVEPRRILVPLIKQLATGEFAGKTIHLCFTCDPYPVGVDTAITREAIRLIKGAGAHVQILTKGDGSRDFDLLDGSDWYGITLTGADEKQQEPNTAHEDSFTTLLQAKEKGIKTWVSFEPVISEYFVLAIIETFHEAFDRVKIGKLNYHPSDINWAEFGKKAEALCQKLGLDYYIKDSLRKEMEAGG